MQNSNKINSLARNVQNGLSQADVLDISSAKELFKLKSKYKIVLVRANKALAVDLLKYHNACNRKLQRARVNKYMSEMENNLWYSSMAQTLDFSTTNQLINGQHRLTAVAETDSSHFFFIVQFDCEEDCRKKCDTGRARTDSDTLYSYGFDKHARVCAKATKFILNFKDNDGNLWPSAISKIDEKRIEDFALAHKDELLEITQEVNDIPSIKELGGIADFITCFFIFKKINATMANEFIKSFYGDNPNNSTIQTVIVSKTKHYLANNQSKTKGKAYSEGHLKAALTCVALFYGFDAYKNACISSNLPKEIELMGKDEIKGRGKGAITALPFDALILDTDGIPLKGFPYIGMINC